MDAAKVELLRSLGQLVRGLSTLFWTLPVGILIYLQTVRSDWLNSLGNGAAVPLMAFGLAAWYALRQLHYFQPQERIWQNSIGRAEVLAIVNAGLAPFLFWWHRFPEIIFYFSCATALAFFALLFLIQVNVLLRRLCAMLPDEHLREEAQMFTTFNMLLFAAAIAGLAGYLGLVHAHTLPHAILRLVTGENPRLLWLVLFLTLLPFGMTLALLWRVKEVIFQSIFEAEH